MTLIVELFGIPRQRAGCARCELEFSGAGITLNEALVALAVTYPGLDGECIRNGALLGSYAANLDGERFLSDPTSLLKHGDELLILSADAGG